MSGTFFVHKRTVFDDATVTCRNYHLWVNQPVLQSGFYSTVQQLALFKPETASHRDDDEPEGARPFASTWLYSWEISYSTSYVVPAVDRWYMTMTRQRIKATINRPLECPLYQICC